MAVTSLVKFTEAARNTVLEAVGCGANINRAAELAGISRMTLWRWLQQGAGDDEAGLQTDHSTFALEYRERQAKVSHLVERSIVKAALNEDWRAGAWWLSKTRPNEFGDARKVMHAELLDALFSHLRTQLPTEVYQQVVEACMGMEAPRRVLEVSASPNEDSP